MLNSVGSVSKALISANWTSHVPRLMNLHVHFETVGRREAFVALLALEVVPLKTLSASGIIPFRPLIATEFAFVAPAATLGTVTHETPVHKICDPGLFSIDTQRFLAIVGTLLVGQQQKELRC
jgi:hypothetical protein